MIVHFGLHLDGLHPAPPRTAVGEAVVGPARFLDLLELQLGLPPVRARPGEALLAYRRCLAALDGRRRFYHRSFREADEIAVARTLLDWRQQWYEAGWSGGFSGRVSQRLSDLADVEHLAREQVPPTRGQRLQRIVAAVRQLRTQIDAVVLHEDPEALPAAWRALLEHFETALAPGVELRPHGRAGTDLHTVQTTLLELAEAAEGREAARRELRGDRSLLVIRGASRDISAHAIGELLLDPGALEDTVVIAERDGIIIDNALERVGSARAGFQHYSRFRAVTQVLKLGLGLLWEPINPHLLLQFLIHPLGPLPAGVRAMLAEAVSEQPGIGGSKWRQALEQIAQRQRDFFHASDNDVARLANEIRDWLECERYPAKNGAPLDALLARSERCTRWLAGQRAQATGAQAELLGAAQAQGEALIAALRALADEGRARVEKIELEQLIDEVASQAPDPATFAQAGHVRATTHPATITTPWNTVAWWDMAPQAHREGYPWTEAELSELRANGVALAPVEARIRARAREWLRPVANARQRLILAVHDREEGRHPLWSRLTSLFDGIEQTRLDDALLDGRDREIRDRLGVATHPLTCQPPLAPRRWWRLENGAGMLKLRELESYSSLQKLIDYPHEWVLRYAARLRPGRAADLAKDNLLYGNLAHRLFQQFFAAHPRWHRLDQRSLNAWLATELPRLIHQEGAVLCEPGSGAVREWVSAVLRRALGRLLEHLRSSHATKLRAEYATQAACDDFRIRGAIDLLLETRDGREVVLDVKWGSESRRAKELAANRHLQLATYAYMRRAGGRRRWPYPAFFIVSSGHLLAQDDSVFPSAITCPPQVVENIDATWKRISETISWRRRQMNEGWIEVNAAGTEPTARSAPPQSALQIADGPDAFDEFGLLTGWEAGA